MSLKKITILLLIDLRNLTERRSGKFALQGLLMIRSMLNVSASFQLF